MLSCAKSLIEFGRKKRLRSDADKRKRSRSADGKEMGNVLLFSLYELTLCDTFDIVQSEASNEMREYKNADQISTDRGY